jgi:multicomponent Na+:H+ antiporter subunit E
MMTSLPLESDSAGQQAALTWQHYALVAGVCMLLWLLLTGSFNSQEIIAGVVVSVAVTALFTARLTIFTGFRFSWLAPLYILAYLAHFLVALVRANFDLARRVLTPSLPIRPQLVEVSTALKSPLGKMLLANTITLTPGTLTVDVVSDRLLIHWVYCPPGMTTEQATAAIAARFEQYLSRFLL